MRTSLDFQGSTWILWGNCVLVVDSEGAVLAYSTFCKEGTCSFFKRSYQTLVGDKKRFLAFEFGQVILKI